MKHYNEPYKIGEKLKKLLTGEDVKIIRQFEDMDERETDVYLVRSQVGTYSICYQDQLAIAASERYRLINGLHSELAERSINYVAFEKDACGKLAPLYFKTRKQYRAFIKGGASSNLTPSPLTMGRNADNQTPTSSVNVTKDGVVVE